MLEVRDDGVLPAVLEEIDHGLHLRSHAAGRELAVREMLLRLGNRQAIDESLARLAEVQRDLGDVRRDHEMLPSDRLREDRRRQVLVDHRLDADELAVLADDRNAASTRRNHYASSAGPHPRAEDALLDAVPRPRARHAA